MWGISSISNYSIMFLIIMQIRYIVYILNPQLQLQFEFSKFLVVFSWQNLHYFWSYDFFKEMKR